MTRTRLLAAALLVLALAGCSSDDPAPLAVPSSSATLPDVVVDPPAPSAPGASSSAAATASPAPDRFPPAAAAVEQGDTVFAVYLAVSRLSADGGPEDAGGLDRAQEQAEAVGYEGDVGGGEVGCDQGAREALGLDAGREYFTRSIFFDTQAQAQQFVDAFEPGVVGLAQVKAFCLD